MMEIAAPAAQRKRGSNEARRFEFALHAIAFLISWLAFVLLSAARGRY
jgi:hypothetical protein